MSTGSNGSAPDGARRVCLLTGAGGTLGTAFCRSYAGVYDIVAVYRRSFPWMATQHSEYVDPLNPGLALADNERRVYALQADLTEPGACERVVEAALHRFGRIDLLVNNAVTSVWGPMLRSDRLLATVDAQLHMNVTVPLQMAVAASKLFWQGRTEENHLENRNVVNVSSVAGLRIYPGSGQSVYAASKAALNHLTGHMALEFPLVGVRVNATAANSFPSHVSVERAARAIRTLDEGRANGTIIVVDGEADRIIPLDPYRPDIEAAEVSGRPSP